MTMFGAYDARGLEKYPFLQRPELQKILRCENCDSLSGGEKQLVCLRRALLSGAHWLALDDNTNPYNQFPRTISVGAAAEGKAGKPVKNEKSEAFEKPDQIVSGFLQILDPDKELAEAREAKGQ